MRYKWLAEFVNARPELGLEHQFYRPWKSYDAIVFLKSMGTKSMRVLREFRDRGRPAVFDANVNYYDGGHGDEYYEKMLPSTQQQQDATEITRAVDGVIADSEVIKVACQPHNGNVAWIPDHVRMDLLPPYQPWRPGKRIRLLWCGEAVKLFEFLAVEEVLRAYSNLIELVIITNDLQALNRWSGDYKDRFEKLLRDVSHEIIRYESPLQLFDIYSAGGVFVSPRFLDNAYNLGHTEWKITLAMACGRIVLCSPVPSYVKVARRSGYKGIRICADRADWQSGLDAILSGEANIQEEEACASQVVREHYSTQVVAGNHSRFLRRVLAGAGGE